LLERDEAFQKLRASDYNAFMRRVGKKAITDLPSAFELIHIQSKSVVHRHGAVAKQDSYEDPNFAILSHTH
jgi:hypothetical protein